MVKLEGSSGAYVEASSRGGSLGASSRAGLVRESFQGRGAGSTSGLGWEAWGREVSHKHPGTIPSSSPQRQSPAGFSSYMSTCHSSAISFSPFLPGKPESSTWPPALPSSALTFPGPSLSLSCLVSSISRTCSQVSRVLVRLDITNCHLCDLGLLSEPLGNSHFLGYSWTSSSGMHHRGRYGNIATSATRQLFVFLQVQRRCVPFGVPEFPSLQLSSQPCSTS